MTVQTQLNNTVQFHLFPFFHRSVNCHLSVIADPLKQVYSEVLVLQTCLSLIHTWYYAHDILKNTRQDLKKHFVNISVLQRLKYCMTILQRVGRNTNSTSC